MREVTIIGAGPGGCMAALLLARCGWRVTLIEQHRFPRDKVCGECLSPLAVEALHRSHLAPFIRRAKPAEITRACLHTPGGRSAEIALPRPMWGLSRRRLDELLLNAARDAGATVRQPVRCEAILPGPELHLRELVNNAREVHRPAQVILADGRAALLASRPRMTNDLGIKAHYIDVDAPGDAVELFGIPGCYGGLAPIEAGRWNVALSVPADRVRAAGGDVEAVFRVLMQENHTLARRLRRAQRISPWLAAPLPRFAVMDTWQSAVIPIGNAAAAVEPIGGEGMGLALRSAELAADALEHSAQHRTAVDVAALHRVFRRLWRVRRFACRTAALAVSQRHAAELAARLMDCETIGKLALRLTGKS